MLNMMKKIEAIIKPTKIENVKGALTAVGVEEMTVSEVKGFGHQKGHPEIFPGSEYTDGLLPKVKCAVILPDTRVQKARGSYCSSGSHQNDWRRQGLCQQNRSGC